MQQPSLKMKYEELVKEPEPDYPLPLKYKDLLVHMTQVDTVLYLLRQKRGAVFWKELAENCEQNLKVHLDGQKIRKIMHAYPESYVVRWERVGADYQLVIDFAEDKANLQAREQRFRAIIVQLVKHQHAKFLKDIRNEEFTLHPCNRKLWHPQFPLQKVPELPEARFPPKPLLQDSDAIQVQPGDKQVKLKKQLLTEIMESGSQDQSKARSKKVKEEEELLKYAEKLNLGKNTSGLSDRLYRIIKAKEHKIQLEKEKQSSQKNIIAAKKEDILKICDIIKLHYSIRQVSNMFLVQVIDKVSDSIKRSSLLSPLQIEEILQSLADFCPEWLTLVPNKEGRILRMNRAADYLALKQKIQNQVID